MTARELLLKAIENADFQISAAVAGLDSQAAETRTNPESMTIRQQVAHTAEAAVAVLAGFEGREHPWGEWDPEDRSWSGIKKARQDARAAAITALPEDDASLWQAYSLLVAHDYYHVGQIAAARSVVHPEWDTYSLYAEPTLTDDGL